MSDVPSWFAAALVLLAEAYPAMRLREGTFRAYYGVLCDLPDESVAQAIARAPQEYPSFFPSAGDLRALVTGKPEDIGLLAWSGLTQAAASVGAYGSLTCEDCAVGRAVERVFGSWGAFCEQAVDVSTAVWGAKRAEFLAAYRDERRQRLLGALPHRLQGVLGAAEHGTWGGRLTYAGEVISERQQAALPGADVKALPEAVFDEPLTD